MNPLASAPPADVVQHAARARATLSSDPLWYKDAIIYELHVKAFHDSNGDGMGDFRGLTEKLDYIQDLGVNTIWLLPFYPSPMKDDGYDVSDYHNIHPAYGTRHDFRVFVREAHRRGLRIITELVVNHTSDQHPWFQAARRAPAGSAKRNYYVWSDDPTRYAGTRIIFTDTETSNWTWDPVAKSYYWHRFFSHQPDLNFDNPSVLRAVFRAMRFWLDMGVDGFRLDAIPYLCEREGTNNENLAETHAVIKQVRAALDRHYTGRMLLAEANQWPEDVREYFGSGDECHMAYHFPLMPRLFMAIAMEERYPVVEILAQTPDIPSNCQWAIFLRNHDELTLEMVTDRERDYMYRMFATDPQMRINVGIRRRLAPLMDNDRERIELISFLLMTLPGSPILYYGDEIGMGDNIYLGDRNGVRTPMQWSPDRNAGFSRADPQRLYLPPIMDPVYGYPSVNVESQSRSSSSLLNWTRRLIATRAGHKAFGRGTLTMLEPGNRKVLAYLREHEDESLLCVANLARSPQAVELDLARFEGRVPVELIGKEPFPPIGRLPYLFTLPGYGYFAFRLAADAPMPAWHEQRLAMRKLPVLVLADNWRTFFTQAEAARDIRRMILNVTRDRLRDQILLPYLMERRWFGAKGQKIRDIRWDDTAEWITPEGSWFVSFLEVRLEGAPSQRYFFPISIAWEARGYDPMETLGGVSFARVRQKDRVGVVYGAFANPAFSRALVRAIGENADIPFGRGRLRFVATRLYPELAPFVNEDVRVPAMEQTNTSIYFGTKLYLKGYRRLAPGINPEVEVGRFLTEVSPYPHISPVGGYVEYVDADGTTTALVLLQRYVENQGDAWTYTLDYLQRAAAAHALHPGLTAQADDEQGPYAFYASQSAILGRRIAELHRAFAQPSGDPAFEPEPVSAAEIDGWKAAVADDAHRTLAMLEAHLADMPEAARADAQSLLANREALLARIRADTAPCPGLVKTRYHGDLHLGQILLVGADFAVIDFEGEPVRPIEARRQKHCPLRDVAGMLRSASYAEHVGRTRLASEHADRPEAIAASCALWEEAARRGFLQGYRDAIRGVPSVPASPDAMDQLIELFTIEKALYELRYEMDNRPDWIGIPARGLLGIAEPR